MKKAITYPPSAFFDNLGSTRNTWPVFDQ